MANNLNKNQGLTEDEILIRDEGGEFKVLKGGQLVPQREESEESGGGKVKEITLSDLIKEIIKESNLVFKETILKRKLEEIIVSRLKDVRDSLETKSILVDKVSRGGLELKEDEADKLIKIIEGKLKKEEVIKLLGKAKGPVVSPSIPRAKEPPPPVVSSKPAPQPVFDFYPEDEEEIKKIKKEMSGLKSAEISRIDEVTDDLIKKFNLPVTDELLKSRLKMAVVSRLKDIRDTLETKDTLIRKRENGGLGLNEGQADELVKEINKLGGKVIEPATTKDIKEARGPRQPVRLSGQGQALKIAPPPPALVKPGSSSSSFSSPPLPQVKRPVEESARPQMVDVKFTPKSFGSAQSRLVGPVEELARLNLIDFRRLSKDPKIACQKIIDKISLLEEEAFGKKIEGIRAWQTSEVYKLYLEIGEESLKESKPIRLIIETRQNQNKPTLTEAEFMAVMELNKNLKF